MKVPRHLWSGNWQEEADAARRSGPGPEHPGFGFDRPDDEPPTAVQPPPPARPRATPTGSTSSEPPRRRRGPLAAILALGVVIAVAGAFLLGDRGDDGIDEPRAALPAVSQGPVESRGGATNTGKIYDSAGPSVVSVRAGSGSGTGFLVDNTTTIVTNAHVVDTAKQVTVRFGSDGRDITGRVMGIDPSSDLAVVVVPEGSAPKNAKPLPVANSDDVRVGDVVVAIGNPFGLDRTATQGIVSALGRDINAPNGFQISGAIQTDAPINPGNSGGPLLDAQGRVIGVNSQIETSGASQGNVGIGFAVPSNTLRAVVPQLEQGKSIARAWLGVETQPATTGGGGAGAEIARVVTGGPAEDAGLQPGDVILAIDGKTVEKYADLADMVLERKPNEQVTLKVERGGGATEDVEVELGLRPNQVP